MVSGSLKTVAIVAFCAMHIMQVEAFLESMDSVCQSSVQMKMLPSDERPFENNNQISRRQILETSFAAAASGLLLPKTSMADERTALSSSKVTIPTVALAGGKSSLRISRTIQGYWQLAGGHGIYREVDAIQNMQAHYDAGITTLDTADIYGPSELIVGKFVKSQPGAIPCTKFCCFRYLEVSVLCSVIMIHLVLQPFSIYDSPMQEINRAEVKQRILRACERLQVDRLPLVAFFWGDYSVKRYTTVALWLSELREEGLIQEIGATNFDLKRLKELKAAGVPLVSHQVQLSALDRRPVQSGMTEWCTGNDISTIAFGTVGSGILSNNFLGKGPPSQDQLTTASMRMYSKTADRFGDWNLVQSLLQTMDAVAKEVRRDGRCTEATIANVAQRFVLQTPSVASVLIGVRNKDHIEENVQSHSFQLKQDEIEAIEKVVAKRKGPLGDVWDIERGLI